MKRKFIYALFVAGLGTALLQSHSGGRAATQNADSLGSPLTSGLTCANCHTGGSFGTVTSAIQILDNGNPVTEYTPGQTYTLQVTVSNSAGSPSRYGSQTVALLSNNTQAGSLSSVTSGGTQISTITHSGTVAQYLEQGPGSNTTGVFSSSWTAPTSGSGSVTFYSMGIAANGSSNSNDNASATTTLSITEAVVTTIAYAQSSFCGSDNTTYIPTITGTTGGTYSIVSSTGNANAAFNNSNGEITPASASASGTFRVQYTFSGGTTTSDITINKETVSFHYARDSFCLNSTSNESPLTGSNHTSGGTYTVSPVGLALNATTGEINLLSSSSGVYTVTYSTPGLGGCSPVTDTDLVTLYRDDASFTYASSTFCQGSSNPTPTVTGLLGGSFGVLTGGGALSLPAWLNQNTGEIDMATIPVGTYSIAYNSNSSCFNIDSTTVTITATGDATFDYGGATLCTDAGNPVATVTGIAGGTFTISSGGVIDASSGEIDLNNTSVGTYAVTYTVAGSCPASTTVSVDLAERENTDFEYADSLFTTCETTSSPATINGTPGGTFSISGSGVIDTSSGAIGLQASGTGAFTVTYAINSGACPSTDTLAITIEPCTSVNKTEGLSSYSVYPNPANDHFTLSHKGLAGQASVCLMDVTGQIVYRQDVYMRTDDQLEFNLVRIPTGLYFLEVAKDNQFYTCKLNIIR